MSRFNIYMKHKGLNDNVVTMECGLSHGLIGQARRGKSDLGRKTILKILSKYQDLNKVWLLTGEGEMFNRDFTCPSEMLNNAHSTTNAPSIHISGDASGSIVTGGNNSGNIVHGGDRGRETALARIPIVPRSITRVPDLDVMEYLQGRKSGIEMSNVIVDNMPISVWYCVEDYSLEPDYRKGDYIALLSYPIGKEVIIPGRLYVVDTYSNGMLMRYLFDDGNGNYTARAKNRESYPDFTIRKEDIIRVYKKMLLVRF